VSRLTLKKQSESQQVMDRLYLEAERKIAGTPPGLCPVDVALSFVKVSHTQSCGKCVPCRVGLGQLENLMEDILDGKANAKTLQVLEETAKAVYDSSDCAIGRECAAMVLHSLEGFREDYLEHINHNHCISHHQYPVPCVSLCPANVDVPGYVALINEGRPADAVKLIRKDNPIPVACAYVCEHPCELRCRRRQVDDAINIRALKRYAVEKAGVVPAPKKAESTGKKVAVVGGGPSGLTASYFLSLMGHEVTIIEGRSELGGMLRYGIPAYRLPRPELDQEIKIITGLCAEVKTNCKVGKDISAATLNKKYDAIYIAIGAQTDNKLGLPGEDAKGVMSAVELLGHTGVAEYPDFTGKRVVVVGGGNVAMDATRTSLRLGAAKVTCVYRRRIEDMTALPEEISGAMAEGAQMLTLHSPVAIKTDKSGQAIALTAKPQIIGEIDKNGRPRPKPSTDPEIDIPADVVIMAVGQAIDSEDFEKAGYPVKRGCLVAGIDCKIDVKKTFSGGDCVTGPSTVIEAVAAGKVAAANIDEFLGFHHEISVNVDIPNPKLRQNLHPCGRANERGRDEAERVKDFNDIERTLTDNEAAAESGRCLRCDHFGYGAFRGGRQSKW